MNRPAITIGLLIVASAGLGLVPAAASQANLLFGVLLALGLTLLVRSALAKEPNAPAASERAEPPAPLPAAKEAPPPPPPPAPLPKNEAETAAITLLGILQEKGRLLDFLMDDIAAYNDAQVGAAARVVHSGCKAALKEHLEIVPVSEATEGGTVTIPTDAGDRYRLVGNPSGAAPFSGTLVHKGWKADSVNLPRVLRAPDDRLPVIAPAQVEVK